MHEMPKIVETYQKFHPRGFGTVAVAMSYDPPDRVFGYAEQTRLPFHVALDLFGQVVRVFGGVEGTLTNFLLDKRGRIVRGFQGEPDFEDLAKPIEKELKREA